MNLNPNNTFNDLANRIMLNLAHRLDNAKEVHLIYDRYDNLSQNPKYEERLRRYGSETNFSFEIVCGHHIRDMNKVLVNNQSKSNLTSFIGNYLKYQVPTLDIMSTKIDNTEKKVFIAGAIEPRENTYVITKHYQYNDFNLKINHLEADTRITFHTNEIQNQYPQIKSQIIIESPDTDVFILILVHYRYFENEPYVWFYRGKISPKLDHRRYIPIHLLANEIGIDKFSSFMNSCYHWV